MTGHLDHRRLLLDSTVLKIALVWLDFWTLDIPLITLALVSRITTCSLGDNDTLCFLANRYIESYGRLCDRPVIVVTHFELLAKLDDADAMEFCDRDRKPWF